MGEPIAHELPNLSGNPNLTEKFRRTLLPKSAAGVEMSIGRLLDHDHVCKLTPFVLGERILPDGIIIVSFALPPLNYQSRALTGNNIFSYTDAQEKVVEIRNFNL